MSIWQEPSIYS
ncbi:uncharacterized protein FFC1_03616 [Fusarium fujikuroi]|nr:uncharacterized protein FFC1_03616 [Fusarium fujikuroi]